MMACMARLGDLQSTSVDTEPTALRRWSVQSLLEGLGPRCRGGCRRRCCGSPGEGQGSVAHAGPLGEGEIFTGRTQGRKGFSPSNSGLPRSAASYCAAANPTTQDVSNHEIPVIPVGLHPPTVATIQPANLEENRQAATDAKKRQKKFLVFDFGNIE